MVHQTIFQIHKRIEDTKKKIEVYSDDFKDMSSKEYSSFMIKIMMKNEGQQGIKAMNTFIDIKGLVDNMLQERPTGLRHITSHDVELLLKYPLESYIIDIDSPTVLSDIVFKLQRMGLGEFASEKEIYDLIVMYEKSYGLSLDYVIELFNEMVRRYYMGLIENTKER